MSLNPGSRGRTRTVSLVAPLFAILGTLVALPGCERCTRSPFATVPVSYKPNNPNRDALWANEPDVVFTLIDFNLGTIRCPDGYAETGKASGDEIGATPPKVEGRGTCAGIEPPGQGNAAPVSA